MAEKEVFEARKWIYCPADWGVWHTGAGEAPSLSLIEAEARVLARWLNKLWPKERGTCATCRHWRVVDRERFGWCREVGKSMNFAPTRKEQFIESRPVRPDFGCVHWEPNKGQSACQCGCRPDGDGWISVDDYLPPTNVEVRAKVKNGQIRIAVFDGVGTWFSTEGEFSYKGVTHWMLFPDPPSRDASECHGGSEKPTLELARTCGTCARWFKVKRCGRRWQGYGKCAWLSYVGEQLRHNNFKPENVHTHILFSCAHWQSPDNFDMPSEHQCEQHTFTTADIRRIVREELRLHSGICHTDLEKRVRRIMREAMS